jgi:hypothetical protein
MEIIVGEAEYNRMIIDAIQISGDCHPETNLTYEDGFQWGIYHPGQTLMITPFKDGLQACVRVGFKLQHHATLFKLCWYQT